MDSAALSPKAGAGAPAPGGCGAWLARDTAARRDERSTQRAEVLGGAGGVRLGPTRDAPRAAGAAAGAAPS